jgi:hypothetical protein
VQVIVESDFSLPTFASCLFRLRGDTKAIAGSLFIFTVIPFNCMRCVMLLSSVPCATAPGFQGQVMAAAAAAAASACISLLSQVALQFLSDRPLRLQLLPSSTNISLPCSWEQVCQCANMCEHAARHT